MPFYEYECSNCKFYVEVLQKLSDEPLKKCPSCKKQAMKKLVSAPAFRLAGGGWYETDFKSDQEGKRNLAGEDKEPEAKADDSKKDKTEAKPEVKAESKAESTSFKSAAKKPVAKAKPVVKAKPKPVAKAKPKPARKKSKR
ncbi:zinc ribbon domain-containing protein [Povalibacter sp.]|uniref:FmdB family zinc ribbon protein n=1 Tax=Povalibacter sp. TaxID=1962978 RepID=UPI002F3E2733